MNKAAFLPVFFIILHLVSAINPAYCQDNEQNRKYGFSIGTGFGVAYGQSLEMVYPIPGDTKGELLSELTWDVKPVCYLGFTADFGLIDLLSRPGFFSSLSLKTGFPGKSGRMEDRDWQSIENNALTNYSRHINETQEFILIDLAAGASFPVKFLYIKPFISGSWMHFSFAGRDGYYKYAREIGSGIYEPIENAQEKSIVGKVISYQQDWLLLAAGFSIGTNILAPFSFDLSFQITPLTFCQSIDNHYWSHTVYKDFTRFGLFLEPKGSFSFTLKNIDFLLDVSYRHISETTGESYMNGNKTFFIISPNKAGAGLSLWNFQFIIKLNL
jgi:outer membrane protease